MASPYKLLSNCDEALAAFIIAGDAGTVDDVFTSKSSRTKKIEDKPATICKSRNAKPEGNPQSGVWCIYPRIEVRSLGVSTDNIDSDTQNANDVPKANATDRIDKTWSLFNASGDDQSGETLGDAITQAYRDAGGSDLTIQFASIEEIDAGFEAMGDAWSDFIFLKLVASPTDLE